MSETFFATLSPMLVMFVCIVIGFVLNKWKLTPDNTASVLSKLENYVIVPALIINTFMKYCTVQSLTGEYRLILYCILVLVMALVIAIPLSGIFVREGYNRNVYKYALTFGNFSFMGNAIVPAILGDEALYRYMLYILPLNAAVYTWGMIILIPKGEKGESTLKRLFNPIFVSIIVGTLLGLSGAAEVIPGFITTSISNLAACMGPLAMILTGFVIGSYDMAKLLKEKKVYIAALLRLIILPLLFVAVLYFAGADRTVLVLTLFAYGTPLGLNTVVFPAAYGGDTETGAAMAMISHTLCVITIPLMYALITHAM
ncbi:MAG: AEC family transporter [Clostridiales bacterium]|nr:AEC family transporter [Clostridiales bacterium]